MPQLFAISKLAQISLNCAWVAKASGSMALARQDKRTFIFYKVIFMIHAPSQSDHQAYDLQDPVKTYLQYIEGITQKINIFDLHMQGYSAKPNALT